MKKRLPALVFSLVIGLFSTSQAGVCLHFFGQAPPQDHQPFMFAVSTTHQHAHGAVPGSIPGKRASKLNWDSLDTAFWTPGPLNSLTGVGSSGNLGNFLAGLADLRNGRPGWQAGPPSPSTSGGSGQTGRNKPVNSGQGTDDPLNGDGSDDPDDEPGDDPGPAGGPSVVPEPTSGLLWCLAGALLLAFTRRPRS